MTGLSIDVVRTWGRRVYERAGMTERDASDVVDAHLVADLRGVDTHGFARLPSYVDRLLGGQNNPRPDIRVVQESAASVLVDGDNGLGQLVCARLMDRVLEKAPSSAVVMGAARGSNDWGCGAVNPLRAAEAGLVAFGTTTSIPTLAPFGARTRMTGNNPVVYAAPRRNDPPIVLDMALTPVALGKVMRAAAEEQPIPESWGFLDRDGVPTTDPHAALRGVIPAIGGYKGTGLSLMMNLLAGILPGGLHSAAVADRGGRGHVFLVVDPGAFGERERFLDEVEDMCRQVKESEPLPGSEGPLLPGEPEWRRAAEVERRGTITYPPSVVAGLEALAGRFEIPLN